MSNSKIIENHINIVQEYHLRYMGEISATSRDALAVKILDLRRGIRWFQQSVETHIRDIWSDIRKSEDLLDYVMTGTTELLLRGSPTQVEKQHLLEDLAESWSWSATGCDIDQTIRERSPAYTFAHQQLTKNQWLIFVYLLQFIVQ